MSNTAVKPRSKPTPKVQLICSCGCNQVFYRYKNKIFSDLNFISNSHAGAYWADRNLREKAGVHAALVMEYLDTFAKRRYRSIGTLRARILPFFAFLNHIGVEQITGVTSKTITEFKSWGIENGFKAAAGDTTALRTFFEWARYNERYESENPVIPRVHGKVKKKTKGRPYSLEEIKAFRSTLGERGDERLRAFFELALASGLRSGELCRLQLQDVSINDLGIMVGIPNKTMAERPGFFDKPVVEYLQAWLAVRRSDCTHDCLFHNRIGTPLTTCSIRSQFLRALQVPFDLHRLRHTCTSSLVSAGADSNTVAVVGGWRDAGSIDGYTRVDEKAKMYGFTSAMEQVRQREATRWEPTVLSNEEFLASVA